MQWLRHTRFDPPTVAEQQQEIMRQERMKMLASQADARWASKPSALDSPDKQQPAQMLQSRDPDTGVNQMIKQEITENRDTKAGPPRTMVEHEAMPRGPVGHVPQPENIAVPALEDSPATHPQKKTKKGLKDSPWNQADTNKDWQPQSWSPAEARR
jgi:NADH dehydrogenase [ubiquinone] 1 alpha subcomplex assembly factor 2